MNEELKNETTNAVLKEMIIGLTKITDDRLGNLKEGVAEIKLLMQGFATKTELEEAKRDFTASVKRIEKTFDDHSKDDVNSFGNLSKQMSFLSKAVFMGMGGLAVVVFMLPFIIHWLHWG